MYIIYIYISCKTAYSSLNVIIPLKQTGATPLFIASQNGHSDVVNILKTNGACVNKATNVRKIFSSAPIQVFNSTCYSSFHAEWYITAVHCQ